MRFSSSAVGNRIVRQSAESALTSSSVARRTVDDLQEATGIGRGHNLRAGGFDVLELALKKFVGHLRLDQIVNARAAATPGALRQLNEFEIWDGAQKFPGLPRDLLAVAK